MKMNKKLTAAFLCTAFLLLCGFCAVPAAAAEMGELVIDSAYASDSGYCEVIGHYEGAELDTQISCVVALEEALEGKGLAEEKCNENYIAWLGQEGTGNNGTFLFQFNVPEKFSGKELVVVLTSEHADQTRTTIVTPHLPFDIYSVDNNSVIYGKDVYYVPGIFYTPDKIAESIAYGGNNIYFKIGGEWYNLMDERAVDNSFLVKENATPVEKIEKLGIRYYYGMTEMSK